MSRADKRFPDMPKSRRAGHALRHDLGYGLSQAWHGFPQARHGFASGWHRGRQAHAQARAERERAKAENLEARARLIPDLREYRKRQKEALEQIRRGAGPEVTRAQCTHAPAPCVTPGNCPCDCPDCLEAQAQEEGSEGRQGGFEPVLLTVRSKSGRTLNPIAGGPVVSCAVWDQEDLDRRLAAAAADPDIEVSTRPLPRPEDYDPAAACDLCGKPLPPGYAGIAHADCIDAHEGSEGGGEGTLQDPSTEGTSPMTTGRSYQGGDFGRTLSGGGSAGDTTYTQQMGELTAIRQDAEEEVNSVRRRRMVNRLDILSGLGLDSASLSDAAAIDDALKAQEKAAQQTLDAADAAISGLKQRHGGIQEAVSSSPVDKPAQPEFYQD